MPRAGDTSSGEEERSASSLESQIKSLLERSNGTVKKLDGQISKLDEHLSKTSSAKRNKGRDAGPSLAAQAAAHPFNKWLVCIAGSDSSRAAESDPLNRPLTFDEAPQSPQRSSSARRDSLRPPGSRRDLASSPCHRSQTFPSRGPSAFRTLSPHCFAWADSPLQSSGAQAEQAPRTITKTSRLSPPSTAKNGKADFEVDDVQRLEERMEAKLHTMLQAATAKLAADAASKLDVEMLQVQCARLKEDQEATRADVAIALKECRAARAAFASEHWSAKKILQQAEQLKQGQEFDAREHDACGPAIPEQRRWSVSDDTEDLHASQQPLKTEDGLKEDGRERVTPRQKSSPTRVQVLCRVSTTDVSALRGLVEEVIEKCDALQQGTAREAARLQDDCARRDKSISARCEQLERGLQGTDKSIALIHADVDKNSARMSRDVNKVYSKMEELESQIMAYKANSMDMHSHVLNSQQDLSEKWRTSHMQLSGQVHATTEWCDSFRSDLTNKLQTASEKFTKMEAGVQQLSAALGSVASRVEGNDNEVKVLDQTILHVCTIIQSMQRSIPKEHSGSPVAEMTSSGDRAARLHRATRKQGSSTDHSEQSTNTAHTTRDSAADISSHAGRDSGGADRFTRPPTIGSFDCRGLGDLSLFSSPILSGTGQELFNEDASASLKSAEAVQRIGRAALAQAHRQEEGTHSSNNSNCHAAHGRQRSSLMDRRRSSQSVSPIACPPSVQVVT